MPPRAFLRRLTSLGAWSWLLWVYLPHYKNFHWVLYPARLLMPFANDVVANFTTGDQLFAYACTDRQADWLPWCPFPYINAG